MSAIQFAFRRVASSLHALAALLLILLALCSVSRSQDCTTYVVVNAYEPRLHLDIQTLRANDFLARISGSDVTIVSSAQDYNSRLLVLLETDGSADNPKIGEVVDIVTRMARQAPEGKPLAFGVYAGHAIFTKGFISDSEKRNAAIGSVIEEADSLGKRVALFDSLHEAVKIFGDHQPGDAVLLVGDPFDDKSSHSSSDVEREFLASGTRLLIMLRDPLTDVSRDFLTSSHPIEKRMFNDLPERTGGVYSEFDPHFFGFVWRGYMLGVKVPEAIHKPKKWNLKLQKTTERTFAHSKLYYPEMVPPCQSTTAEKH